VPLQGHWQRVNTPVRETTPRERVLVRAIAALVGIAVGATIVVLIATNGGSGTAAGCVNVDVPSTMGGSAIHACGKDAADFCRGPVAHDPSLRGSALPKCRDAGYAVAPQ
jgi:hypothetical protein